MPKDSKRNIQNYQLQGGHLNEFEFQKNQTQIAEESESPFLDETNKPNIAQATKRVAEVIAEAHGIVEERKKSGLLKAGGRKSIATGKKSTKKVAAKFAKKKPTQRGTKKRASVKSSGQKPAAHR